MTAKPNWWELLDREGCLTLVGAHDALSARLIEQAGFKAYSIGGFSLVGARYGLPDIGLVGLAEMVAGVQDIITASSLPVLIDGDHGYGDVKNVTRTIRAYERLGASAIFLEDQVAPTRCGHMAGKEVVDTEVMERRLRAAAAARGDDPIFIIARTDARAIHGLDEAFRRAERYIEAGADGIFVEAPETVEELALIAETFDVPQMCNMLVGGQTPILPNAELEAMGYRMIIHGIALAMRVTLAMQETLRAIAEDRFDGSDGMIDFDAYKSVVGFEAWADVESRFGG
jgi:2-methylisocitrate lyase-like PEP mutase family enzyme